MHKYSMKFYFFSLITEKVYCRSNMDKYGLAELISGMADGLNGGQVVREYEDFGLEPQMISCGP